MTDLTDEERALIIEMCRAHDREEAAQCGEPCPWRDDFDRDPEWEDQRFAAMREAYNIAAARQSPRPRPGVEEVAREVYAAIVREADDPPFPTYDDNLKTMREKGGANTAFHIANASAERICAIPGWSPPEGWVLVPKEPTEAMADAGLKAGIDVRSRYRAMLATAPLPTKGGE